MKRVAIKGWVEHPSPRQLKQGDGWFGELSKVYRQNNDYVVMIRDVETEWGIVQHACMRNTASTDISWAEKQRIKNEIFGKEAQAIEFFPKESVLVDQVNMYHFWVLPEGFELPFGLHVQSKSNDLPYYHKLGEPVLFYWEDEWRKGKIINGYRTHDGIINVQLEDGRKVSCGEARREEFVKQV